MSQLNSTGFVKSVAPTTDQTRAFFPMATEQAGQVRQAAAYALGLPVNDAIDGNGEPMELALILAGEFLMGFADDDPSAGREEKPRHCVTVTRPFYMGVFRSNVGAAGPEGPHLSERRTCRGGSRLYKSVACRSAYRCWCMAPDGHGLDVGSRVAVGLAWLLAPHRRRQSCTRRPLCSRHLPWNERSFSTRILLQITRPGDGRTVSEPRANTGTKGRTCRAITAHPS
jgi:hypothetical protein